jgi:aromatic-L-amino-acid/L-tryptophan decarboxylase
VLGDMMSTGLSVIGLNWQASPALTELEQVMCDWLRDQLGLPPDFSGVIQDTASVASLLALVSARERTTNYGANREGLQDGGTPLVIYTSAQSHSSIGKAALLAGFGRNFVRSLPVDADFRLQASSLATAIAADRAAGLRPCAVVATTGTTPQSRAAKASGCMSTPRWAARRCCCPSAATTGPGSRAPIRSWSIRTNG